SNRNRTLQPLATGDSGEYQCGGRHRFSTEFRRKSNKVPLNVSDETISVSQRGLYWCRGGRGNPVYYTEYSDSIDFHPAASLTVNLFNLHRLIFDQNFLFIDLFTDGDVILVMFVSMKQSDTVKNLNMVNLFNLHRLIFDQNFLFIDLFTDGDVILVMLVYMKQSNALKNLNMINKDICIDKTMNVDDNMKNYILVLTTKGQAELRKDSPAGGSVTLTCSVKPSSSGWKYFWYRGEKTSEPDPLSTQDVVFLSDETISVSQGGLYWCRGGRGNPVYYTEYSDSIVTNRAVVVTLQPNWPEIYRGETITLTCEIEDGGDTEWESWTLLFGTVEDGDDLFAKYLNTMQDNGDVGLYETIRGREEPEHGTNNEAEERSGYINVNIRSAADSLLTIEPNSSILFTGESVTFICDMSEGEHTDWSQSTNQDSAPDHMINQDETQSRIYASLLHGDVCLYETIRGREEPEHGMNNEAEERSGYINVNIRSAADAVLTLQPNRSTLFNGEVVEFTCDAKDGKDTDWSYTFNGQPFPLCTKKVCTFKLMTDYTGEYQCTNSKEKSNPVSLNVSDKPQPVLTVSPSWLSPGDSVTLSCSVKDPSAGWRFFWYKAVPKLPGRYYSYELLPESINGTEQDSYIVHGQTHTAGYKCRAGRGDPVYYTDYSKPKFVWSGAQQVNSILRADKVTLTVGGNVLLTCSVDATNSSGWNYKWFIRTADSFEEISLNKGPNGNIRITEGGVYWCRGVSGKSMVSTKDSNFVTIHKIVSNRAVVTLQPNVTQIFMAEMITLRCEIEGGRGTEWMYEWMTPTSSTPVINHEYKIDSALPSNSGNYSCKGRHREDLFSSTNWSQTVTLTVINQKPTTKVRADKTVIPAGGRVTLTCTVNPSSSGWKYYWYRGKKNPRLLHTQGAMSGRITVSHGGLYWCKGGRGNPVYYTQNSNSINITLLVTNRAVVIVEPNWPKIYKEETISLKCEIKGGEHIEWEYEWKTSTSFVPPKQRESLLIAYPSHNADYSCKGRKKSELSSMTEWSDAFPLRVYDNKPQPVLTVSPSWLSPGDSVTLSYFHPAASLTVNPDRVQHFFKDSVSISCEGNSMEWRVRRFTETGSLLDYSDWGTMNGTTCNIHRLQEGNTVYWCESGSGEFSNGVNITAQNGDIILVSPVHPVTEGDSVSLSCKTRTENNSSKVDFYKNGKLIQNDTRGELNLSAVSKSDEGFYRCTYFGKESKQSWMSVKCDASVYESVRRSENTENGDVCLYETIRHREEPEHGTNNEAEERSGYINVNIRSAADSGDYWCKGKMKIEKSSTEWSYAFKLIISDNKAQPVLTVSPSWLSPGDSVTLSCSVKDPSAGWSFFWYKAVPKLPGSDYSYELLPDSINGTEQDSYIVHGQTHTAGYVCRAGRGDPVYYTDYSESKFVWSGDFHPAASLTVNLFNLHRLIFDQNFLFIDLFTDGDVILVMFVSMKTIRGREEPEHGTNSEAEERSGYINVNIRSAADKTISVSQRGLYWCRGGRGNPVYYTEYSDSIGDACVYETVKRPEEPEHEDNLMYAQHTDQRPKLRKDSPAGGSVTLTCSVKPSSSGWKYFWYRGEKTSDPLSTQDVVFLSDETISVSQGGLYWCRGGRGKPSLLHRVQMEVSSGIRLFPNYQAETTAMSCYLTASMGLNRIPTSSMDRPTQQDMCAELEEEIQFIILTTVNLSLSGLEVNLFNLHRLIFDQNFLFIDLFTDGDVILVSPVLPVSEGDSVTLGLQVMLVYMKQSNALKNLNMDGGFFWYKAVPKLPGRYYSYELLPDSINGTEQDSYIVHGQTHTAGYVCRAGRGDPVYYTNYSKPKFVWSGDVHPASVTVSPDRVQHFSSDSVSLSCEGKSSEWRVMKLTRAGHLSNCSEWGTLTGSTCNIHRHVNNTAVYWCESGSGPVQQCSQHQWCTNLTSDHRCIFSFYGDVILVSPVLPVSEGDSVTLGCKLRTENVLSNVDFYKNDKLIQKDTRGELNIAAVSKSDEGFYKCRYSGKMSQQSWMSVRSSNPDSSPFPVLLIVGLVCGVLLIILLLLFLYRYKKSKEDNLMYAQVHSHNKAKRDKRKHLLLSNRQYNSISVSSILNVTYAVLTLQPNRSTLFNGEVVEFTCDAKNGKDTDWSYTFNGQPFPLCTKKVCTFKLLTNYTGEYQCTNSNKKSNPVSLNVSDKAQPVLTVSPSWLSPGDSVTLSCSVKDPSAGWRFFWYKAVPKLPGRDYSYELLPESINGTEQDSYIVHGQTHTAGYVCRAGRGDPVYYTNYSKPKFVWSGGQCVCFFSFPYGDVILVSPVLPVSEGDSVTLGCKLRTENVLSNVDFYKNDKLIQKDTRGELNISAVSKSDEGFYKSQQVNSILRADKVTLTVGGNVLLTCSVDATNSSGWNYKWFIRTADSFEEISLNKGPNGNIRITEGGVYWCRGVSGKSMVSTKDSNFVTIHKIVSNRAVVTLQPNVTQIFMAEMITLRCEIEGGRGTEWMYEWMTPTSSTPVINHEYKIDSALPSNSGNYSCKGRHREDLFSSTNWSQTVTLTVINQKPTTKVRADKTVIPAGGRVTLTCTVNPSSSGWKYYWYRGKKNPRLLHTQGAMSGRITVSHGGLYWCKGGRGNPVYYTQNSNSINITLLVTNRAVVIVEPNWPKIHKEETISLKCEIKGGEHIEWEYEWKTSTSFVPPKQRESLLIAYPSHNADYSCKGRKKSELSSMTEWSDAFPLRVYDNKPQPVLTVSPSWLSPGDSVTLSCEVEHPSAGWRFFWYKAVPKLPGSDYYSYELLPESISGTEHNSLIVHEQTHTAGYVCRAGRGSQVCYTHYSKPKFVLSGDFHPAASLTVNPDRVQHFFKDSVSISCEGNSMEWRVRRFTETGSLLDYSDWGTMNGTTCNIHRLQEGNTVYWCESGSGEFSNGVNITAQNGDIILVSPVHPVTEGDSVSLSCKTRTENNSSKVDFYKNGKLIQNDTRGELNLSAVSKSDEGFYRCTYFGKESKQSWMSVKCDASVYESVRRSENTEN
ncbi:hypothetical protein L3Q82_016769, partial [Scortum barcoo]